MNEIEVKASITSALLLLDQIRKKFPNAAFEEKRQIDTIYVEDEISSLLETWPGKRVCRIRDVEKKFIFTIKTHRSNQLDRDELEFDINDKSLADKILRALGFEPALTVSKTRRQAIIDDIEICIDSVDELGDFIELEILTTTKSAENAQKELTYMLHEIAGDFIISDIYLGYDALLLQKKLGTP